MVGNGSSSPSERRRQKRGGSTIVLLAACLAWTACGTEEAATADGETARGAAVPVAAGGDAAALDAEAIRTRAAEYRFDLEAAGQWADAVIAIHEQGRVFDRRMWERGQGTNPEARRVIESKGLTVDEFGLIYMTLRPAYHEAQVRRAGQQGMLDVPEHQVEFALAHMEEIEAILTREQQGTRPETYGTARPN